MPPLGGDAQRTGHVGLGAQAAAGIHPHGLEGAAGLVELYPVIFIWHFDRPGRRSDGVCVLPAKASAKTLNCRRRVVRLLFLPSESPSREGPRRDHRLLSSSETVAPSPVALAKTTRLRPSAKAGIPPSSDFGFCDVPERGEMRQQGPLVLCLKLVKILNRGGQGGRSWRRTPTAMGGF